MAIHIEIKNKKKKSFSLLDIINDDMSYGIFDEAFRLEEGKMGDHTIIFNKTSIGRGIELTIHEKRVAIDMVIPSTPSDMHTLMYVLNRLFELCETKKFICDDEKYKQEHMKEFESKFNSLHQRYVKYIYDHREKDYSGFVIIGAYQPIALGDKEFAYINNDWEKFGQLLYDIQVKDIFYCAPIFGQREEDHVDGIYVLTDSVTSSLPLKANYMLGKHTQEIQWFVSFYDWVASELLGEVSYDFLLNNVDTTNHLDAARFIIELDKGKMIELIKKYEDANRRKVC